MRLACANGHMECCQTLLFRGALNNRHGMPDHGFVMSTFRLLPANRRKLMTWVHRNMKTRDLFLKTAAPLIQEFASLPEFLPLAERASAWSRFFVRNVLGVRSSRELRTLRRFNTVVSHVIQWKDDAHTRRGAGGDVGGRSSSSKIALDSS